MLRIISIYSDRGRFYVDREIIKSFLRNVLIEWQKDELIIWSKRRVCGGRFYDNLWTRPQRYHTWHILDYVLYFNNIYIVCAVWESRPVVIDVGSVEMAAFIKLPEFHWIVVVELLSLSCRLSLHRWTDEDVRPLSNQRDTSLFSFSQHHFARNK